MSAPEIIAHIPASRLPGSYKLAPRLWRHSLHTICSRVAMFPPQLTHYFIAVYSKKREVVIDPWAGVGTAPLQACLDGRTGIGSDVSPEAWTIMSAKLNPPRLDETLAYLSEIHKRLQRMPNQHLDKTGARIGIRHYYEPETLKEVLKIRALLRKDRFSKNPVKRRKATFISALMLGIMHGDRSESLSIEMDSSKAYSPAHILRMQRKFPKKYVPKYRNVIISLLTKVSKVLQDTPPTAPGYAYNLSADLFRPRKRARLIITSPPYLDVHNYAYDNRARLWFLGYDYKAVHSRLFSTEDLQFYLAFVGKTIASLANSMMRNSTCIIMFGDVRKGDRVVKLGDIFAAYWLKNYSKVLRLERIIIDRVRPTRRRNFNLTKSQGIRCERILVFCKGQPKCNKASFYWSSKN
jgi:hypothetical protein